MSIDYKTWCSENSNIIKLAKHMQSSLPEQYIGFYLHKIFGRNIEYHKTFSWLGKNSIDMYISSLKLAIEYDGYYYHSNKRFTDINKTKLCSKYGITTLRILENTNTVDFDKNIIGYLPNRLYTNVDTVIDYLILYINTKFNTSIKTTVDINHDKNEILSYVQDKYYKKTIAYIWPEVKEYWAEDKNKFSIYDVFYTSNCSFNLRCPHCGKLFQLHTRYCRNRKSLIPCECEYSALTFLLSKVTNNYIEKNILITFDNSLESRRLYDRMMSEVRFNYNKKTHKELEMYKKLGFEPPISK